MPGQSMKTYTITSHVADQVAALEAGSIRRRLILRPFLVVITLATLGAVAVFLIEGQSTLAGIAGAAGLSVLLILGALAAAGPSEREIAIKRAGAAGEAVLPQILRPLPDTYVLLNGVPTPGAHSDIDHVLVGPSGIWAIEAKHHVGMVQCVGDAWGYARTGPGGMPIAGHIGNPSQQARRAAKALERYLQQRGASANVQPLVVFTHPRVELSIEQPTVAITRAQDVPALVTGGRPQLDQAQIARVVATLRTLRQL